MCLALLSFPIPSRSMNILLSQQEHAISKITEIAELVNETLSIDSFYRRSSHDALLFRCINWHQFSSFRIWILFGFLFQPARRGKENKNRDDNLRASDHGNFHKLHDIPDASTSQKRKMNFFRSFVELASYNLFRLLSTALLIYSVDSWGRATSVVVSLE